MTTATETITCPAFSWCEATHVEDRTMHLQEGITVQDLNGKPFEVSAFCDSGSGRHGLYLGGYEISPETARLLVLELNDGANLSEQAANQVTR